IWKRQYGPGEFTGKITGTSLKATSMMRFAGEPDNNWTSQLMSGANKICFLVESTGSKCWMTAPLSESPIPGAKESRWGVMGEGKCGMKGKCGIRSAECGVKRGGECGVRSAE